MYMKKGSKHTAEALAKMQNRTGTWKWTDEQKKSASERRKGTPWTPARIARGNPPWSPDRRASGGAGMLGKKHSEETKAKMRTAHANVSDETKAKMSAAKKGKPLSEAHKKALSLAHLGKKRGPYNK